MFNLTVNSNRSSGSLFFYYLKDELGCFCLPYRFLTFQKQVTAINDQTLRRFLSETRCDHAGRNVRRNLKTSQMQCTFVCCVPVWYIVILYV